MDELMKLLQQYYTMHSCDMLMCVLYSQPWYWM